MKNEFKKELPKMLEVSKVVKEAKNQRSFFFKHKLDCKPGQFLMVWIPGKDMKPYAVSYHSKNEFGITSKIYGPFSAALDKVKKGDKIGIMGPYGSGFKLKKKAIVVGGGVGMASVSTLIDDLKNPVVINAARWKEWLIYTKRYKKSIIVTDDGSAGRKGFAIGPLKELLKTKKYKVVYTCGPEIMMKKVLEVCNQYKVECQGSVERYMSCAFGICGKCMVNGFIDCMDGPVFRSKQLNEMKDFGKYARLRSGEKVTLEVFHKG